MRPYLTFATLVLALIACTFRKEGGPVVPESPWPPGSLVCVDSILAASSQEGRLPSECPLLVVESHAGDTLSLLTPLQRRYRLPAGILIRVGSAPLGDSLVGATEGPFDRMVPPPANPGVVVPSSDYGLLYRASGGGIDTLFPEDWPALTGPARACPGWQDCIDSLLSGPWKGMLRAPFLPPWRSVRNSGPAWRFDADSGKSFPVRGEGSGNLEIRVVAIPTATPFGLESRRASTMPSGPAKWVFIHTVAEDGSDVWVWRTEDGPLQSLKVPFMEQSVIDDVDAVDLDGDGYPEIRVHAVTHYGDGSYETLYLLRGGPASGGPRLGSVAISGSSGEPGGSEVIGTWWTNPPRLYNATASLANEPEGAESHDLLVKSFGFDPAGNWTAYEVASSRLVLFAEAGMWSQAQAWADSLEQSRPDAARAGIHPLPRLVGGKLLWQPGAVAPDSSTAKTWTDWDARARVGLPSRRK
jgi:hypothetical protein